jgi:hypothetical protein
MMQLNLAWHLPEAQLDVRASSSVLRHGGRHGIQQLSP